MTDPTTYEPNELIARIGTFFLVTGALLFLLFIASDVNPAYPMPDFNLMCAALLLIAIGAIFRRAQPPPPKAERFRYLRKLMQQRKDAKKATAQQAQKKK